MGTKAPELTRDQRRDIRMMRAQGVNLDLLQDRSPRHAAREINEKLETHGVVVIF